MADATTLATTTRTSSPFRRRSVDVWHGTKHTVRAYRPSSRWTFGYDADIGPPAQGQHEYRSCDDGLASGDELLSE